MGLMEPKHDFEDKSIQVMYEYSEYSLYNNAVAK